MEPNVSIIVPVYNNPEGIRQTLRSLTAFNSHGALREIAVVDNASTDNTQHVIREYSDQYEIVDLFLEADIQSSYAARNTGIRNTSGQVVAFVDADMTVADDWLNRALHYIQKNDASYLGCNVKLTLPQNPSIVGRFDFATGFPVKQYIEKQGFSPTCCLFVNRTIFEDVGLFNHRLISGGDKEFGNRVQTTGYKLHYGEDIEMYHPVRNSLVELIRKDIRVGRGLCQLQKYHPERYGTPSLPPKPSGIKTPSPKLPVKYRILFNMISTILTGFRGLGYYREFFSKDEDDVPVETLPARRSNEKN